MLHTFSNRGETERLYSPAGLVRLAVGRCGGTMPAAETECGGLASICEALEAARPRQTTFGKLHARAILLDALAKRLRLADYLRRFPEIRSVSLPTPLFIVAPFRTGTTFLHRLLAQDPENRWPRVWEVAFPPPAEPLWRGDSRYFSEDPRIADATAALRTLYRANPTLARLHSMGTDLAEECFGLLETSLTSHSFMFCAELPSYLDWLDARDAAEWRAAYEIYADQLRVLHWSYPGRRWVLKSPVHLWNLDLLPEVFPEGRIVQLHRDPIAVMASFCRLLAAHRQAFSKQTTPAAIGEQALTYMKKALNRAVAARHRLDRSRFIDLGFEALTRDPVRSARTIYAGIGERLTPKAAASMTRWLSRVERRRSSEDATVVHFGLDPTEVRAIFAPYAAFLGRDC